MSIDKQLSQWCEQSCTILNSLPSTVLVTNTQGRIEFVNQNLLDLTGFSKSKVIGEKLWIFLFEDQVNQTTESLNARDNSNIEPRFPLFKALAARESNHNIVWKLKTNSKDIKNITSSVGEIRNPESDEIIGYLSIGIEASELSQQLLEQKHLEQQYKTALVDLTGSQKRYQQIFANTPLGIFHFDIESVVLDANDHFIELLGSRRELIIGLNMLRSLKDQRIITAIQDCLKDGIGHYEGNYQSMTGTTRPLRGFLKAIRNTSGEVTGGVAVFEDITEQYKTKLALESSEASYREIFDNAMLTIYIQNKQGAFLKVNKSAEKMYGYTVDEILGKTPEFLSAPEKNDMEQVQRYIDKAWTGIPQRFEFWGKRKNGEIFPKDVAIHRGEYLEQDVLITFAEDITERKSAEAQINSLANQDSLTGLPNRRLIIERTDQLLKLARRHKMDISLLYLDLDKFKDINDTQGHDAGDQLLIDVSLRLQNCLRDSDTLARLGGDEFAILLPDSNKEHAENVAHRILEEIERPFQLKHTEVKIKASMGISLFPQDGISFKKLFRHADIAMYKAKSNNKGLMFFQPEHREEIEHRVSLEKELVDAIENDQLVLHYQPRLCLESFKALSVEALVRWQHPQKALIYPGVFIPIAEASELIFRIGEWVLAEAIQQAKTWQQMGLDIPVAVNISIQELQSTHYASKVSNLLNKYQLPPSLLELEITETAAMTNVEQSLKTMTILKELGIKLSIDDFGTGYSSLNYLKKLPADFLKIDRSFIVDIDSGDLANRKHDKTIIKTIVALGKSLKMPLIAEGVESEDQEFFLQTLEIDMAQGFKYCKPLPADKYLLWHKENGDGIEL